MASRDEERVIVVYTAVDAQGSVRFVGRTRNFERRAVEHAARGWTLRRMPEPVDMTTARGVEQILLDRLRDETDHRS